uniref:PUM-HD domain-containing protein n=1 Tax=Zooxanthella nutricula TaxID=1333877 RepID=A0A7S2PJZ8_9DINO
MRPQVLGGGEAQAIRGPLRPGPVEQSPPRPLSHASALPAAPRSAAADCRGGAGNAVVAMVLDDVCSQTSCKDNLVARYALDLSHDREGCLLVQQVLEQAQSDDTRLAIAESLRGHVWDVVRCPHANHVLQKIIVAVKPSECQFIIDEIAKRGAEALGKLARHKYAYRVLQRMLEQLHQWQMAPLIKRLAADSVALSMHRFGTFIVQHALEYGTEDQQNCIIAQLTTSIPTMSRNNDACMVLDKALVVSSGSSQATLTKAILDSDGSLVDMAHTRRGHVAVISLLQIVGRAALEEAARQLAAKEQSLRGSRFGRSVLNAASPQLGCQATASLPNHSQ